MLYDTRKNPPKRDIDELTPDEIASKEWREKNKPRLLPSATADGAILLGNLFRRQAGIPTQGGSKRTHGGRSTT